MKFNAQLDVDVVALETDDDVTCLLTFEAPTADDDAKRPGESLVVVVDRSGSMTGEPLQAVHAALHNLVDRMRPQDSLGIVAFDSHASVAVPTRLLADHHVPTVHHHIQAIRPGGSTDLSAGYLLGLSEARRTIAATGATVVLLSDGHANSGMTDPVKLGQLAASAHSDQVTTTTIGIGAGYDETLLSEIATSGSGTHRFAFTPDDAQAVVAEEAGDLLSKSILNAFVRVRPSDPSHIDRIGTLHDVPRWLERSPDGAQVLTIPLGDLYSGEHRELLINFAVPAVPTLAQFDLAQINIEYVAMPSLEAQTITWPLTINIADADHAAARTTNPTVTTAKLIAESQQAKKRASDALKQGDTSTAARIMDAEAGRLRRGASEVPGNHPEAANLRTRLADEERHVHKLADGARQREARVARKSFIEDSNWESRGRSDRARQARRRERREW